MKCPKCLKCQYFAWWDGDYVCMERFQILSPKHGVRIFTDELVKELKRQKFCPTYEKSFNPIIKGMYIEEFEKWNELHNLEKQLERHINNSYETKTT